MLSYLRYSTIVFILITLTFFYSILLHELEHAVPKLFFTKGIVKTYVGSHGDPRRSFKICPGRLEVSIKYNPLLCFENYPFGSNLIIYPNAD